MQSVVGVSPDKVPSDEVYCTETNIDVTYLTNQMQEALAAYSYTLVRRGWLCLMYNGRELMLNPGDLYIYSPGFQVTVLGGSHDYQGICLIADEYLTLSTPVIWNIVRTAYYPIFELGHPVVRLTPQAAAHMLLRMQEIQTYQSSSHHFLDECLRTLYTLFILDLRDAMETTTGNYRFSERTAELFVHFARLLPRHFAEQHNIDFYADQLHVTTTHLSRIVRQVTGRTVVDHINQMLLMEALWLLKTTNLSLAEIAERLHFADQSSFGKFFLRMKGMPPKKFRNQGGR